MKEQHWSPDEAEQSRLSDEEAEELSLELHPCALCDRPCSTRSGKLWAHMVCVDQAIEQQRELRKRLKEEGDRSTNTPPPPGPGKPKGSRAARTFPDKEVAALFRVKEQTVRRWFSPGMGGRFSQASLKGVFQAYVRDKLPHLPWFSGLVESYCITCGVEEKDHKPAPRPGARDQHR